MTPPAVSAADSRPAPASGSWVQLRTFLEWGMLLLTIVAGLFAWGIGIAVRRYDYDEVQRAHSVWLAAQGLRPYTSFFEVHPPYFVLLGPVFRWRTDACDVLQALRLFSGIGNLAFLAGLVALTWRLGPPGRGGRWVWLGVLSVAFQPTVLDFLIEFRIDGWGYALAVWSLAGFVWRPGGRFRFGTFGVLSGIATLLFCPKLAILPPLMVALEILRLRPGLRSALGLGAAYVAGVGIAGACFALFLLANGIDFSRTYLLLFRYHTLSNAHSGYELGLLRKIAGTPLLLAPIALGFLAWVHDVWKRRTLPEAYPAALALWLLIQALLVAYHYKQYYAPWFLFGSAFVICLGRALEGLGRRCGALGFVVVCGTTIYCACVLAVLWQQYGVLRYHCAIIRAMNLLAGPEDRVVAPPPEHPIKRRDVFFLWFNTSDPNGYDSERILESLAPYQRAVSVDQNRAALEKDPPAFVVLDSGPYAVSYPAGQWRALLEFLPRHRYRVVKMGGLRLALRLDRYQNPAFTGLFADEPGPLAPVRPVIR